MRTIFIVASLRSSLNMYVKILLVVFFFTGCKKFLDIKPSTNTEVNPRLIAELEQLLSNAELARPNFIIADLMSDDVFLPEELLLINANHYVVKAYQWWPSIWDPTENDGAYQQLYECIFQCNIVLERLPLVPDGSTVQKNTLAAQAKINRAYFYLQLVNQYGKTYTSATANQDLAVPLVLKPDPSSLPSRATVAQVYAQVLKDLQEAISASDLPNFGVDIIRPGKAAALALLARTYLYMENYEEAFKAANAALVIRNTVLDHNQFNFANGVDFSNGVQNKPILLIDQVNNPEILFAKVNNDYLLISRFQQSIRISEELKNLLGAVDLRYVYNIDEGNSVVNPNYFSVSGSSGRSSPFNYSIGVPEMLLIKAEYLARQGDADGALAQLELIRQFRFKPADYVPLVNKGAEDALKQVLDERRRELFLHGGVRLFDLKRLNKDLRFSKELKRVSDIDGRTIATLATGSPAYLFPFTPRVIANNPNIIQNSR